MARGFNGASYVHYAGALSAPPLTFACWFKTNLTPTNQAFFAISSNTGQNNRYLFTTSVNQVSSNTGAAPSSSTSAISTTSYTVGSWQHVCGVIAGASSRTIFLNGGGKSVNTTTLTPGAMHESNIGVLRGTSGLTIHYNGLIAVPSVWNVALNDDEVASLAAGYYPDMIRPQNLVSHVLFDPRIIDLKGNIWTNTGSSDSSDAPPLR